MEARTTTILVVQVLPTLEPTTVMNEGRMKNSLMVITLDVTGVLDVRSVKDLSIIKQNASPLFKERRRV